MTRAVESARAAAGRGFLEAVYRDALAAVDSGAAVRRALQSDANGVWMGATVDSRRVAVLAVGKAAGPMASEAAAWLGDRLASGLAITRDGLAAPLPRFEHLRADHPIPGERSAEAARRTLAWVSSRSAEDLLLVLLSGGASSLLAGPPRGLRTSDIAEMHRLLLASGAEIDEVNLVRRQLLPCAGGRLARVSTAKRIEVWAVSDVPGDRLEVIGSGPFYDENDHPSEAIAVLEARGLWSRMPAGIVRYLEDAAENPGAAFRRSGSRQVRHRVVASNRDALAAAVESCRRRAVVPVVVSAVMRGAARSVGRRLGHLGAAVLSHSHPSCLIAGGETTVILKGSGRGGRSQELALAAALALEGRPEVALLAAGTDGSDGPTDAAGAFVDGGTVARGSARGVDARASLANNDAYAFFNTEGGLLRTGSTGTNVMDLVLVSAGRTPNS